jgi:hypothetical protein
MEHTLIPETTQVRFYGEDGKAAQFNSTITKDLSTNNLWPHRENMAVEVDEDHDLDNAYAMAVKNADLSPVFCDPALDLMIRPVMSHTQVVVKVSYKAVDKNRAEMWQNELRTRFAMFRDTFVFDIDYSYDVPEYFLDILVAIHDAREKIAGYGDSVVDWAAQHFVSKARLVSNLTGTAKVLAIAERQSPVQGFFDFTMVPEKATRDEEPNLWVTSFSFRFSYDKPIEMVINYPMIVHQTLLDKQFRPAWDLPSYYSILRQFSASWEAFNRFTAQHQKLISYGNRGLSYPPDDNFLPRSTPHATARVFQCLLQFSADDMRSVVNLGDLGDFNLQADILEWMKGEAPYMTQMYQSIFQLHLYEKTGIKDQSWLAVDANLNVVLTQDADLRRPYHLLLSLVANPDRLPTAAKARLAAQPVVAAKILNAVNASLRDLGSRPDMKRSRLTPGEVSVFDCHYDADYHVCPGSDGLVRDPGVNYLNWSLVETLFISAGRA